MHQAAEARESGSGPASDMLEMGAMPFSATLREQQSGWPPGHRLTGWNRAEGVQRSKRPRSRPGAGERVGEQRSGPGEPSATERRKQGKLESTLSQETTLALKVEASFSLNQDLH